MQRLSNRGFIALILALALGSCAREPAPVAPSAEEIARHSAELTAFLDAQYEEELQQSPEDMTAQGRKDRYDELDDRSEAAGDALLAWRRKSVAQMKEKFDPATLNEDARLSFDIWELELKRAEEANKWRRHRYVFGRGGAPTGLPNFLINFHRVDDKNDMEAYIARVARIDEALDQLLVRAKAAAADGIHMPGFRYDEALSEIERLMRGAPFSSGKDAPLFADGKAKIAALRIAGKLSTAEANALTKELASAMTEQLRPAYGRVIEFLQADKPHGQQSDKQGALALPQGAQFYESALFLQTTTTLTANEIHELGLREVARIRAEMERIKESVGFKGTLEDFFRFMRTDRRFYLPNDERGVADYLKLAEHYLGAMKAKLPEYFGLLPKADLIVKRVEPFREQPGGAQHYFAGTPDGSRPGIFYAHLSDMNAMPTYQLEVIAYHEGLPGHHLQISIQQELTGLPKFRTQYGYAAFSEGWGLYTESLAKEMGFFTDPYNDFGRLATEVWRAIRLVVDTGIHAKGWTQQQAEEYFLANSPQPAQAVKSEVERYILNPGQATSYKVGMISIQKLRDTAKRELGARFDYRKFHDVVLGGGALPIPVLETKVKRWMERQND